MRTLESEFTNRTAKLLTRNLGFAKRDRCHAPQALIRCHRPGGVGIDVARERCIGRAAHPVQQRVEGANQLNIDISRGQAGEPRLEVVTQRVQRTGADVVAALFVLRQHLAKHGMVGEVVEKVAGCEMSVDVDGHGEPHAERENWSLSESTYGREAADRWTGPREIDMGRTVPSRRVPHE